MTVDGVGLVHQHQHQLRHDPCQRQSRSTSQSGARGRGARLSKMGEFGNQGFGSACPHFLPACAANNNPSHGAFMATPRGFWPECSASIQQRIWDASNETNLPTSALPLQEWFLFLSEQILCMAIAFLQVETVSRIMFSVEVMEKSK